MSELEKFLETVRKKYELPALAAAVTQHGHDTVAVCGVRKHGDPAETPVTPQDKFHFGSCGKAVTAALIHQLIAEGRFTLKSTVGELLPGIDIAPGNRRITVGQLLTHMSGLIVNQDLPYHETKEAVVAMTAQEQMTSPTEMRKQLSGELLSDANSSLSAPAHQYSNANYIVLGAIAEAMTGERFEDLVRDRIFKPLGMNSAGFGPPAKQGSPPDQPWGHRREGEYIVTDQFDNPAAFAPAGTMHASLGDWLKFLKYEMKQHRLLNPALAVSTQTGLPYTDSALYRFNDVFVHEGNNLCNRACQFLLPKQNAAFVVVTNDGSPAAQAAIEEVTKHIFGKRHRKACGAAAFGSAARECGKAALRRGQSRVL